VGTAVALLVEENVAGEELALARAWFQAPEVDGLTVLATDTPLTPGTKVDAKIIRRNGFDLEAVI
jgi:ribosomal protein S12 methylthiotransferase